MSYRCNSETLFLYVLICFQDIYPMKLIIHYGVILIAAGLVVIFMIFANVLIHRKLGRKQSKLTIDIKIRHTNIHSVNVCVFEVIFCNSEDSEECKRFT